MRKEFEDNEEKSKKLSEENLTDQDEIDDETFQKILEEEFIEREKQIEEALFADDEFEDFVPSDEEVRNSYQKLMRRFEAEKEKENMEISEELVPDEKLVHRAVSEKKVSDTDETSDTGKNENTDARTADKKKVLVMDEVRERRKKSVENEETEEADSKVTKIRHGRNGRRLPRNLGKVVGMAVVAVACVFAASMTSEANRTYLVNSVRIWSGDDSKTVAYNDDSNENANLDEDKAIADIEKQLQIEMPKFYYRPYGIEFIDYTIDKLASLAWIEYEYENQKIMLLIDKQNTDIASKISSVEGTEQDTVLINSDGINIVIKKILNDDDIFSYSAEWYKEGTLYLLFGKMDFEEIKKIVEKMKF